MLGSEKSRSEVTTSELPRSDHDKVERNLVRKLDLRLIPYLSLLYMFSFLDRVNIGHARLYGLESSLGLTSTQYSWSLSIFFVGYVLFEVPSNLMMKRTSPPIWISRIMITWGIVTMCMAAVSNFSGLIASRFFLGLFEAGLFPGIIFFLSFWYTREEQGIRIAFFFSASSLAGAFGGLIAYGINTIDGRGGLAGWQWIFIVEGLPTVVLGMITWFVLPSTPENANWLSPQEQNILTSRLRASHVELDGKKIDKRQFLSAFTDIKTYLYMLCYIGFTCPLYSMALLTPTIIKDLGFPPLTAMLLTVPPYAIAFVITLIVSWHSDRVMERGCHIIISATIAIIGFIILIASDDANTRYGGVILGVVGICSCLPPTLSWSNNNIMGSTKSATCSALIIGFGNVGGIIAGQFYRPSEAPFYHPSHATVIGFLGLTIITALILKVYLHRENRKLDRASVAIPPLNSSHPPHTSQFRYIL